MSTKLNVAANSPDQGTNVATIDQNVEIDSVNGTAGIKEGRIVITKASAIALTLNAPVAGTDDGKVLHITSATAAAHVITCSTDGFNAKGSSGTATFGASIGNGLILMAYNGHWLNLANTGVTYA